MTDIYKPPSSDVTPKTGESVGNIFIFERFSTWYVLGLSIVTLNLYAAYWLYTRTKKLNKIVHFKISMSFCQITAFLYFLSYAVFLFQEFGEVTDPYFVISSLVLDLGANVLILVWVYKFRNRLKDEFPNENTHIGIVAPFFFLHLFLQYKLNELLENNQHNKQMQTDAAKAAPLI